MIMHELPNEVSNMLQVDATFDAITAEIEQTNRKVESLMTTIASAKPATDKLSDQVHSIEETVKRGKATIDKILGKMTTKPVATFEKKLGSIETTVNEVWNTTTGLIRQMDARNEQSLPKSHFIRQDQFTSSTDCSKRFFIQQKILQ